MKKEILYDYGTLFSIRTISLFIHFLLLSNCFGQSFYNITRIREEPVEAFMIQYWTEDSCLISSIIYTGDSLNIRTLTDSSFNAPESTGDDLFDKYIWFPDADKGCLPYDICYNNQSDKYYVYGGRKLLILDGQSNSIIKDHEISETADIRRTIYVDLLGIEERLLFNESTNRVFCADDDGQLHVIDGENNSIIENVGWTTPSNDCIFTTLHFSNYYSIGRIFWVRVNFTGGSCFSYIRVFDKEGTFKTDLLIQDERITDIASDIVGDHIYVTSTAPGGGRIKTYLYSSDGFQLIYEKAVSYAPQTIVYVPQNGSNPPCFLVGYSNCPDERKLKIFNGWDGTLLDSIVNPYFNSTLLGYYNGQIQKAYITGIDYISDFYKGGIIEVNPIGLAIDYKECYESLIPGFVSILGLSNPSLILSGSSDKIQVFDVSNFSLLGSSSLSGSHSYRLCQGDGNDELNVFSANLVDGNYSIINIDSQNQPYEQYSIPVGGATTAGCYNAKNNKIYFIQNGHPDYYFWTFNDNSLITIIDGASNENIEYIPLGNNLLSIAYNYSSNRVLVSSHNDNKVYVINGETNGIEMSIEIDSPSLLYSGSDNMVFCVGAIGISGGIYLIDAITGEYEEIPLQCPSDEIFDFVYDGNQILYVCYNEEGYIKAINTNTLEISDPIDVHQNPTDLEYDPGNNLLFCADDYGINIISINGWNEYNVMEIFTGDYTKRMVFRPQNQDRKLYLIGLSHLSIYNLDKSVLLQQQVDAQGILYNPFNDRVYLNYDYLPNNNYHGLLVAYDCNTDQVCSEILLSQKNLMMGIFLTNPLEPYQMVLNSTSNQLYCGNGAFSNISVIDCKNETRSLRPGWTWLSFPRLDREGNDPVQAVDLLTGHILPENFISGQMRNLPSQSLIENYIDYLIDPFPHWTPEYGLLDEVISTCGYKLYTSPEEERRMDVAGTIVDRQTSISIYSGYENWVGYFHEMPQDVFDALATEVLEELTLIKTQDWACAKYYMPPIQQGDPPVPVWICSTKNPLRYGDMVILKTSSDLTFQWNPPEARPEHKALKNTEHYVFEEKSDYVPIYIQLDSTDNPDEIGAFINDSCMGACGVEWGDTLVMIRGYFGENQGEEVTFEEYYDSLKAAPVRKNEYYVYDPQSFLYKKRMIKTNDKNDWYLISFSPKKNTPATPLKNRIHFFPNPCMNNCLIEFQVPVESDISIDLYDIYGRLIKTMVYGHYLPGTYSVLWNNSLHSGRLIPEGVYLLMMTAGSHRDAEKVIITM